jgi:hypothetical protein
VLLDGAFCDDEALRDPRVRQSLRHQRENFALSRGELVVMRVPFSGLDAHDQAASLRASRSGASARISSYELEADHSAAFAWCVMRTSIGL